jgi:hypothetical protein
MWFFFTFLIFESTVQLTVEADVCTAIHVKCSYLREGCHTFCQGRTEIEGFDSL